MKGVRSLLGVPLLVEGAVLGVLHVGTVTPREFTNADAALLQLAAAQAAPAIDRARLFDALDREHRSAVALQRSLLPDRLPDLVGIDAAVRYLPARDEVGGDWYDVIDLPGGRVGLGHRRRRRPWAASGGAHGSAAHGPARLRAGGPRARRDAQAPGPPPADDLRARDGHRRVRRHRSGDRNRWRYSSAGHPPPVIVRGGREASLLGISTAPPLGTLPFATYHETEATLEPGDTILLYTDGLVERRREPLTDGLERLRALAAVPATADQLCQRVIQGLMPPGGGDDDIAVVALRIVPVEAAMSVRFPADPQVLAQMRRMLGPLAAGARGTAGARSTP